MDDCRFKRSSSISSFETNHSSWSLVGEDDFDLLDQDGVESASEDDVNEMMEKDEQVEDVNEQQQQIGEEYNAEKSTDNTDDDDNSDDGDDDDDDDNDGDNGDGNDDDDVDDEDDDISVVTEEEFLDDPATLTYTDVVEVSKQLDHLSKCFDSPFNRVLVDFGLEQNTKCTTIISAAAIALIIFYFAYGSVNPESISFTSTENVCFVNEDHLLGLQHRDAVPSFLSPFFGALLNPSLPAWSLLSPSLPKPQAIEQMPWVAKSENIIASQNERRYLATNQCERASTERQFSTASEIVRRYLKHTKKVQEPNRYELSSIILSVNETMFDGESAESSHNEKEQKDLQVVITDSSKDWISAERGLSEYLGRIEMRDSKFQKLPSISKPSLSLSSFSADDLFLESRLGSPASVSSSDSSVEGEITSFPISVTDFDHVEQEWLNAVLDLKTIKLLEKRKARLKTVKSLEKKNAKPKHSTDLSVLSGVSKSWDSEKIFASNSKKEMRKKGKSEMQVISSMKRALSKVVERAKVHGDKLLERFSKTTYQVDEKIHVGKGRCVLNSTCNVLAKLARTLASITLFPAIVGQTNAAKYISSLLDLSTCTGFRLMCERCWWTRDCCPKDFNTKRFVASQGHKMFAVFEELGWLMPEKKRKAGDGKSKFKLDKSSRFAGSVKDKRSRQDEKKSMERYSRKNDIQGRIH